MIEIITRDGTPLDLSPDDEFDIEYESPLFSDDRIPVPYSTSIAFLPTEVNSRVFGYLDAMMLEPSVRNLDVEIRVSGIPLFQGSLEYESYEDGRLNYNFSGKSIEDNLKGYIHETDGLTRIEGSTDVFRTYIFGDIADYIERAHQGDESLDFGLPAVVSAENIAKIETDEDPAQEIKPTEKFKNWPWKLNAFAPVAPAVRVKDIIEKASSGLVNVRFGENAAELYSSLAVLAMYSKKDSLNGYEKGDYFPEVILDVASKLPECSVVDFIINVMKVMCASLWYDGGGLLMLQNSDIIDDSGFIDWSALVSDVYSLSVEAGAVYEFAYQGEGDNNTLEEVPENIETISGLDMVASHTNIQGETIMEEDTGDIYSFSGAGTSGSTDILYQNLRKDSEEETEDSDMDTFDASPDFHLVTCVPLQIWERYGSNGTNRYWKIRLCPKLDFPALGDDRMTDMYIGILFANQLSDKGIYPKSSVPGQFDPDAPMDLEPGNYDSGLSVVPGDLRKGLHKSFADWIGRDRVCASVDLDLSVMDLANLRLWRKVYFCGRTWMIKKLSMTFKVRTASIAVSGDFVSV